MLLHGPSEVQVQIPKGRDKVMRKGGQKGSKKDQRQTGKTSIHPYSVCGCRVARAYPSNCPAEGGVPGGQLQPTGFYKI